jgi:hypothetical protein
MFRRIKEFCFNVGRIATALEKIADLPKEEYTEAPKPKKDIEVNSQSLESIAEEEAEEIRYSISKKLDKVALSQDSPYYPEEALDLEDLEAMQS